MADLPFLAACLLTEDECVLTTGPGISNVEVLAGLLLDLGAELDGIGSTTLRIRAPRLMTHAPIALWLDGCVGRCCCWGLCWAGSAAPTSRRQGAIFPRVDPLAPISRRSRRWERGRVAATTTSSRRLTA